MLQKANNKINLVGQRFGYLLVIEDLGSRISKRNKKEGINLCLCECGEKKIITTRELRHKGIKSCGCKKSGKSRLVHGNAMVGRYTSEYYIWQNMRRRCYDVKTKAYKNYGGRGIKVCDRWESFKNFLDDMGKRPSKNHSLDRFPNNNGDYEKSNCRWASKHDQDRNRRTNIWVTYKGELMVLNDIIKMINGYFTTDKKKLLTESTDQIADYYLTVKRKRK